MDEQYEQEQAAAGEEEAALESATGDDRYAVALERLRVALAASVPGLRPEMLSGKTLEAVEASFAAARELADQVRAEARRELAAVPAGAPGRTVVAGPASAFEKIRSGLGRLAS